MVSDLAGYVEPASAAGTRPSTSHVTLSRTTFQKPTERVAGEMDFLIMSDAVVNAQPENSGIMVADIPALLSVYRSDTIGECWGRKVQIENEIRRVTTANEPSIEIGRLAIHSVAITVKGD